MTSISTKQDQVLITELLSACADACARGCQVIRFVNNKRQEVVQDKKDFDVTYKVADDPRSALTEADLASQRVILYCLRHKWGDELNIIGEEDPDDDDDNDGNGTANDSNQNQESDEDLFEKYNIPLPDQSENPVKTDLFSTGEEEISLSLSDLTLYIDPMDGTREFVEQRLHNVQCLIGITWKGRPIGGIIGLPFLWNETGGGGVHVVTGLNWGNSSFVKTICMPKDTGAAISTDATDEDLWLSLGDCSSPEAKEKASECIDSKILNVFTGDSNRVHKKHALKHLETWTSEDNLNDSNGKDSFKTILDVCIAGGCGNKILRTTASGSGKDNGGNALSIIPPGTCSWDTAAPTAILFAALAVYNKQGKVTDMFGGTLVYNSTGRKVTNDLGALISIGPLAGKYHDKLCETFRADEVILHSLLRDYWIRAKDLDSVDSNLSSLNNDVMMRLKIAQQEAQAIDLVRCDKGYIMTCNELKSMLTEQISSYDDSELIGYSIPEKDAVRDGDGLVNKCVLKLFWKEENNKNEGRGKSPHQLPESVIYEKVRIDEFTHRVNLTRD